jgi:hypothetical protein
MTQDPHEWNNLLAPPRARQNPAMRAQADRLANWIPEVNRKPAPRSAHRILTYDKETGKTTWQGGEIKPEDPVPELQ